MPKPKAHDSTAKNRERKNRLKSLRTDILSSALLRKRVKPCKPNPATYICLGKKKKPKCPKFINPPITDEGLQAWRMLA